MYFLFTEDREMRLTSKFPMNNYKGKFLSIAEAKAAVPPMRLAQIVTITDKGLEVVAECNNIEYKRPPDESDWKYFPVQAPDMVMLGPSSRVEAFTLDDVDITAVTRRACVSVEKNTAVFGWAEVIVMGENGKSQPGNDGLLTTLKFGMVRWS